MKTALLFGASGLVGGHLLNQLISNNNYSKIKGLIDKISKGKWKKSKIPEKWDGKTAKRVLNIITELKQGT